MKKNLIKYTAYILMALPLGGVGAGLLTSCSDVKLEEAAYRESVSQLVANYQDGSREVTLQWQNPTMPGQTGVQIIQDNKNILEIDEVVSSYTIKKAPTNVDVTYTVKEKGDYILIVKWGDESVPGSPFKVNVP